MTLLAGSAGASHSWNGYHWSRTTNPLSKGLGDNVNSTWDSYLRTAASDWSASSVINTSVVTGGTSPSSCTAGSGRIEVCNASYGSTGWLGIASITVSGSHITSGTVRVNDTYFNTATYNTVAWRNLVMCQEVGHIWGLDHQDENFNNTNLGTCMDYTNSPGTNQHPNAHDYQQLESIYAHSGFTAEEEPNLADAPPAMFQMYLAGPEQWGTVVDTYDDGRPRLYEQDFGNGHKVLTHVFWVPDGNRVVR